MHRVHARWIVTIMRCLELVWHAMAMPDFPGNSMRARRLVRSSRDCSISILVMPSAPSPAAIKTCTLMSALLDFRPKSFFEWLPFCISSTGRRAIEPLPTINKTGFNRKSLSALLANTRNLWTKTRGIIAGMRTEKFGLLSPFWLEKNRTITTGQKDIHYNLLSLLAPGDVCTEAHQEMSLSGCRPYPYTPKYSRIEDN